MDQFSFLNGWEGYHDDVATNIKTLLAQQCCSLCLITVQTLDDREGVVLSHLRQKILTLEAEPPRRVERMS